MDQTTTSSVLITTTHAYSPVRRAVAVVAGSVLVGVCSHISIPLFFTPVPMTLQPGAVLLLGLLMIPPDAFAALSLFLMEGAVGLQVFTPQGHGGMLQLLGPTGGYLMSYPFVAALISFVYASFRVRNFTTAAISAAVGNIVILAAGTVWLATLTHQHFAHVIFLSILPFLPGDVLKIFTAAGIAAGLLKMRRMEEMVGH